MKKHKILYIISSSRIGGAEKELYFLMRYLDKEKFAITLICPEGPMQKKYAELADEIMIFDFKNWFSPVKMFALKKYIEEIQPSLVHTHLYAADFLGILAARMANVNLIISTVHGRNFANDIRFGLKKANNFVFSIFYRFIYYYCDKVITVCSDLKEYVTMKAGIKINKEKIEVIYNGVESVISDCAYHKDQKDKFIGVIANFEKIKGHHVLLKAIPDVIKKYSSIKFLFIGEGKEKNNLKSLAEKLKISQKVIFTGCLDDIHGVIKSCDIIVSSSFIEGTPLSILEAMSQGKPIIATKVGGIPELLKDGKTALLIQPKNAEAMTEALLKLLWNNQLAEEIGIEAKRVFINNFTAKKMGDSISRLYSNLLSEKI